ncbi:hypothetical protein FDP41_013498 [Naegleria fowleri]|uniref:60S ribosomal protein L18a n=1 Tax=Naegleria fowleri TaxID=5763 RepID=A0A6A5C126_NAEFO|nr:uncharacterized protein FDP41_013498 [Naegleria fowleri]KAF0980284.1 hypothetical protein FDP41_013498 [Naegleria fowleri]CAG4709615.1 unnamed protein product [Naegleria fowleri]
MAKQTTQVSNTGAKNQIHHYEIIARKLPGSSDERPPLFRMQIFAPNKVIARSRFWYFMSRINKLKKANGEIVSLKEVKEAQPGTVKNFGVWIRYNSRSNIRNMYKEYRDTSVSGAVKQMYDEMASRHMARFFSIHVRKAELIQEPKRAHIQTFSDPEVKFPPIWKKKKIEKQNKTRFTAAKPKLILTA